MLKKSMVLKWLTWILQDEELHCSERRCRFHCTRCDRNFCFEHIAIHFRKGEFIPKGFKPTRVYTARMDVSDSEDETESSTNETEAEDVKDESDSDEESSSDTW